MGIDNGKQLGEKSNNFCSEISSQRVIEITLLNIVQLSIQCYFTRVNLVVFPRVCVCSTGICVVNSLTAAGIEFLWYHSFTHHG